MTINPQHIVLFHYFRLFLEKAHTHGIDVAPLKGAHLLTSVYPERWDRGPLADVDFLVRARDFERCCEILQEMGFKARTLASRPVTATLFYERGLYLPLSDGKRILFEPHQYLVQPDRLKIDYDALWERSISSLFDGVPCRRLCNDDHFLHTIVHLVTDRFIDPGRALTDLEMLLTHGGVSLDEIMTRMDDWGARRGLWVALKLLALKRPNMIPEHHIEAIAPPWPVRRYLQHMVLEQGKYRYPQMDLRSQELILWPALFDDIGHFLNFAGRYLMLRGQDAWATLKSHRLSR